MVTFYVNFTSVKKQKVPGDDTQHDILLQSKKKNKPKNIVGNTSDG